MPTYDVPVKTVSTEVYRVRAKNREAAMSIAIEASNNMDHADLINDFEGEPEVDYQDIEEVKET